MNNLEPKQIMKNWSEKDLERLVIYKQQGLTWDQISVIFPDQTPNSLRKTYYRYMDKFNNSKGDILIDKKSPKDVFNNILVISDMHHPYSHPDTIPFLNALNKKFKFDKVVCIGDEVDYHAMSFHDSNPDLPSAGEELKRAIRNISPLYSMFPNVTVIESNHGSMVLRKGLANGMPLAVLKSYNEILKAPKGWEWKFDIKLHTPLGPVYFCHGKSGAAGRLASQYGMSCVQGHFHEKAQITYISTPEKLMFDAHTGCLADDKSLALGYNKINPKRPIVSIIVIINGIPQIIPMILDTNGRWIKRL